MGIGNSDKEPGVRALKLQSSIRAFASSYLADNMFTLPGLPTQDKYEAMLKEKERDRNRIKEERIIAVAKSKTNSLKRGVAPSNSHSQSTSPLGSSNSNHLSGFNINAIDSNHTRGPGRPNSTAGAEPVNSSTENNDHSFFKPAQTFFKSWRGEQNLGNTNNNKHTRSAVHAVSISKPTETSWGPAQARVEDHSDPVIQQIQIIESYLKQARDDGRWEEAQMFERNLQELRSVQQQGSNR